MVEIGYAAEHEQFQPMELLDHAVLADKAGFDFIWTSDHFHPWAHTNAASGFAWTWMTAVAERTKKVKIGTSVTCPSFRYHPAIVAQAFATMGNMYPGRITLGLGSGEGMNEIPLGFDWPPLPDRITRLEEAITIIRKLWDEEWVTYAGKYWKLKKARLYTRPPKPIPLFLAAMGPKMARLAGEKADGMITLKFEEDFYKETLFPQLERGAKNAGRDYKKIEKAVELWVSYDEDYDRAMQATKFWGAQMLPFIFKYGISDPREIESYGQLVGEEQIDKAWCISPDTEAHIKFLQKHAKLGFNKIYVLSSSPNMQKTIEVYGKEVLPHVR